MRKIYSIIIVVLILIFAAQIAESKWKTGIHLQNGEYINGTKIKIEHPDSLFLDFIEKSYLSSTN